MSWCEWDIYGIKCTVKQWNLQEKIVWRAAAWLLPPVKYYSDEYQDNATEQPYGMQGEGENCIIVSVRNPEAIRPLKVFGVEGGILLKMI